MGPKLRIFMAVLALAPASAVGGCVASMMRQRLSERARDFNAPEPRVFIHRPGKLAGVSKLVVPDFRVLFVSGNTGSEPAFVGSFAEGVDWFAGPNYGIVLAEYFEEELLKAKGFEVLERNRLQRILNEQSLQMSGLGGGSPIDPTTFAGADTILLGTVTNAMYYMPNDPQLPSMAMAMLSLRLIDIATGEIIMLYRDRRMMTGAIMSPEGIFEEFAARFVATVSAAKAGQ